MEQKGGKLISKTSLLAYVIAFRWREVREGLAENPKLTHLRDQRGRNWLHLCCGVNARQKRLKPEHGIRTSEVLLEAGLDLNEEAFREGQWKATPLWYAVARGENLALARSLLERGADPNHCLWAAAWRDDLDAIRLLLEHGAELDPKDDHGMSPFLAAIGWSRFRAAEALLEAGANVDFQDAQGMTALHYMLKKRSDTKHFRTLAAYRPRVDLKNREGITAAELMERRRDPEFRALAARLSTRGR
jgi:ankyrin repeat protein